MNLINLYLSSGIENIPIEVLERILNDQYSCKVMTALKGMLLLSNQTLIKCVDKYYEKSNIDLSTTKKIKSTNECFHKHKMLGIENVKPYDCKECHKQCINLFKQKSINKKY